MSDELLHHGYEQSRLLSDDEKLLLTALLSNRADFRHLNQQIVSGKVIDMLDGGMGSVKFLTAEERSLGATLVEAEYLDTDGVPVQERPEQVPLYRRPCPGTV